MILSELRKHLEGVCRIRRERAEKAIKKASKVYVWVQTCKDEGVYINITKAEAMRTVDNAIEHGALSLEDSLDDKPVGLENWRLREELNGSRKSKNLYIN